jgi:hypothetical protein
MELWAGINEYEAEKNAKAQDADSWKGSTPFDKHMYELKKRSHA